MLQSLSRAQGNNQPNSLLMDPFIVIPWFLISTHSTTHIFNLNHAPNKAQKAKHRNNQHTVEPFKNHIPKSKKYGLNGHQAQSHHTDDQTQKKQQKSSFKL